MSVVILNLLWTAYERTHTPITWTPELLPHLSLATATTK
jgi:hypothetical protein